MTKHMQAGKFKAECLKIMDEVQLSGKELVITKRHVPIVKLVPVESRDKSMFGAMKGTIHSKGDLIAPIDEVWDAAT